MPAYQHLNKALIYKLTRLKKRAARKYLKRPSGAKAEREALNDALAYVRPGDTLVVWRLDRLGRSLKHLIEVIKGLHEREVGFKSLVDAIDTLTPTGQFFFHVTGAFAELERNLIRERTRAGLKAARARGRNGGCPKAIDPKTFDMAIEIYNSKKQRLAKCVNGWVLPNEHFAGIWNCTTSNNELTYRKGTVGNEI